MTFNPYQQIGNGSIRELIASDLDPLANYQFKLTASNKDGEGPYSNPVEWGLVKPQIGSWWTQGQIGIVHSAEDFPSELPAGWWVSELDQPLGQLTLNRYPPEWGGVNSLLASYQIPVASLIGRFLQLQDEVTIYPIKLEESNGYQMVLIKYHPYLAEPSLILFYIKDGSASSVVVPVLPPPLGFQDFVVMTDGLMLVGGMGQWYARGVNWAYPRYDLLSYPSNNDVLISTYQPIPHLQNQYPVTLDTTYQYAIGTPATPGNENAYSVRFIPSDHGPALALRSVVVPFPLSREFVLKGDQTNRGVFGTVTPMENVYLSRLMGSKVNAPNTAPPYNFITPNSSGEIVALAVVGTPNGFLECTNGSLPLSAADYPPTYTGAPHTTDTVTAFLSYYPYRGLPTDSGPQGAKAIQRCVNASNNTVTSFVTPDSSYGVGIISHYWIPNLTFSTGSISAGVFTPNQPINFGECTMIRWTMLCNIGSVGWSAQRRYYCDLPVNQFPIMSDWILYEYRTAPINMAWVNPTDSPWTQRTTYNTSGWAFPPIQGQELPVWAWDGYYPLINLDERFRGPQTATPVRYRINLTPGDYVIRYLGADVGATGTLGVSVSNPIAPLFYYNLMSQGITTPYLNKNGLSGLPLLPQEFDLGTTARFHTTCSVFTGSGSINLTEMAYVIEITGPTTGYFDIQPYHEIFTTYSHDDGVFTNVTDCFGQYVIRENLYITIFALNTYIYNPNGPAWKDAPGVDYWYLPQADRPTGFLGIHKMNRAANTGVTSLGFADIGVNEIILKKSTIWTPSMFNYGSFLVAQAPLDFAGSLSILNSGGIVISSSPPAGPDS